MMPLLVILAVVALILALSFLVWRHRRRTLTGVMVGSFMPQRGMTLSGTGLPPGAKITRARRTSEGAYDLTVTTRTLDGPIIGRVRNGPVAAGEIGEADLSL